MTTIYALLILIFILLMILPNMINKKTNMTASNSGGVVNNSIVDLNSMIYKSHPHFEITSYNSVIMKYNQLHYAMKTYENPSLIEKIKQELRSVEELKSQFESVPQEDRYKWEYVSNYVNSSGYFHNEYLGIKVPCLKKKDTGCKITAGFKANENCSMNGDSEGNVYEQ
jgi:hypothetical protein